MLYNKVILVILKQTAKTFLSQGVWMTTQLMCPVCKYNFSDILVSMHDW